ncbi:hypothetical protein OHA18_23055 [Kribbella sp. NBC_00709]|uniref:hypothetical protein n=1 Tax=Kribbella sp. NBC_00709 TaxID=2975972 RepID=UPI002E27C1F3|nr:hypothetical protein [Kribbella sp. NBC_00709]
MTWRLALTVVGDLPLGPPPTWAVLERDLLETLDKAWQVFSAQCTAPDGSLPFVDRGQLTSRDAGDDFYEAFFNWPTLYLLSGSADLLTAAKHHWNGVTAQLAELGRVEHEYEIGYDWFHQGEGNLFFYGLCLADPQDQRLVERAARFAELYTGSPACNYDADLNIIRAPHTGSGGPRWGLTDAEPSYGWDPVMQRYGLPIDWLGVDSVDQLKDPASARMMGEQMRDRMGRGDAVVNLAATSLVLNAYLMTGERSFADWVVRYTDGWWKRAAGNDGVLPDNVGLSGRVGEYLDGRWYGGNYGWSFPHGISSVGAAAVVAAQNAALLTGDRGYWQPTRRAFELVLDQASMQPLTNVVADWRTEVARRLGLDEDAETLLVPTRLVDGGWFDPLPPPVNLLTALWHGSREATDLECLNTLRATSGYDWAVTLPFRNKGEDGHEQPWLAYLAGAYPGYPTDALRTALSIVAHRLALIEADDSDPGEIPDSHYQKLNPVVTEALLQLCCGAPQVVYNGGLLQLAVRYWDAAERRPGLPTDVAALVFELDDTGLGIELVNLSLHGTREVVLQSGTFAQHLIESVRYDRRDGDYPGSPYVEFAPRVDTVTRTQPVDDRYLAVHLEPLSRVRLRLTVRLDQLAPTYSAPWDL